MATGDTDRWVRPYVLQALATELDRDYVYAAEVYALSCVARLESFYGRGWRSPPHAPDMVGSNNVGSVQCVVHSKQFFKRYGSQRPDLSKHPVPSAVAGCCALAVDSSPVNGGNSFYVTTYKTYADPQEGLQHVSRLLLKMGVIGSDGTAVRARTFDSVSRQMYLRHYYEGTAATPEQRIAEHAEAVARNARDIAKALGEPIGLGSVPVPERVFDVSLLPELPGSPPEISDEETMQALINAVMYRSAEDRRASRDREMRGDE